MFRPKALAAKLCRRGDAVYAICSPITPIKRVSPSINRAYLTGSIGTPCRRAADGLPRQDTLTAKREATWSATAARLAKSRPFHYVETTARNSRDLRHQP